MKKTALITGATSGIGLETAKLMAEENYRLILTGRRHNRLIKVKDELHSQFSSEVFILNFDIQIEEEVNKAIQSLPDEWKSIDILINNAGLTAGYAPIDSASTDDWNQMIDTNIKGLLYISRLISAGMKERKSGHIINISSIAGKEAYPNGSVYCGTKHAVMAISQAMRIELVSSNIKVTTIAPGAVETEFSLVRFKGDQEKADSVYEGFTPLFAKDIAETIMFVISRPVHVNIDDLLIMPSAQASARDFYKK